MNKLWQHQQYALDKYKNRKYFGLLFSCGLGKGQPVTSKVLTKNGFVTIGSLKVGDKVISPTDGKEYPIDGIYNKGVRHINKITCNNKAVTYCDDEHLWNVQTSSQRSENKDKFYTVSMEDLKKMDLKRKTKRGDRIDYYHNVYLPVTAPVHLNEDDGLDIDIAYMLGIFIGDGCFNGSTITLPEDDIKAKFERIINNLGYELSAKQGYDYRIDMTTAKVPFRDFLKQEGVEGYSYEKRVPTKYLHGSIATRTAMLEGLIDSDGTVTGGGKIDYLSTSKGLIEDITFLVSSLGGVVHKSHNKQGKYKDKEGNIHVCRLAYRIAFRVLPSLNLSVKHSEKLNKKFQRGNYVCIENIEDAGNAKCVCIHIDSPDHLYITDDFIVTHNTLTAIKIAEAKDKPTLIIAPNALCEQWKEEIEDKGEKDWEVLVCTSKTKNTKKFKTALEHLCNS